MSSKKQPARGFFDEYEQLEKLSKLKDPLEKLNRKINFELFRATLNTMYQKSERKSEAGAKPFDYVLMFKIIILQRLYNLSDEQMEFQLNDRLSFKRFVGLNFSYKVPDLWRCLGKTTVLGFTGKGVLYKLKVVVCVRGSVAGKNN